MERRLAAILVADVVGYSRLMEKDEVGTFERWAIYRKELFEPEIAKHQGRIFKLVGDALLAEFASVVDAVECAVALQGAMGERNSGFAKDRRIDVRIGINLGDVIVEGEDRHGDGVNIAARLQELAEPGGIAVSRTVVNHVRNKLEQRFDPLGVQRVKNITEPIGVYRWVAGAPAQKQNVAWRFLRMGGQRTRLIAAGAIFLLLAAGGATYGYLHTRTRQPMHRLSIVVLPFSNLSNDPEQDYFADAVTNDLTTDLSRIEDSFVIAPNTARSYAGKNLKAKQIGSELNVRYILDGSLRRTGNQIRINAQLTDTETETTVWSDRFDGDWTKSIQLEDEITGRLARRLDLELTNEESRRAQAERPNNPDAVDLTMRAWSVLNQPYSREQLEQSRSLFEQALHIDAGLPKALVGLSQTLATEVNYRWSAAPEEALARATEGVNRVLSAYPEDAMAHFVKGEILRAGGKEFASAISEFSAAILINPSLAPAFASLGNAEIRDGRAQEAFVPLETAIRLSPRDPLLNVWYFNICHAYSHLGQDNAAIEWCRRSVEISPFWISYVDLASAYAWTGRKEEAQAAVGKLLKLMPNYTVDRWAHAGFSNNPVFLKQYQRIIEGLRKAGLPES
ncbi:adenylate/guanylate cyclase domain-containing protein [Rhizobium sp. RAF56]|uniref:adenylate/guanylate cyclase domain-containing protein n=1 Tax=Rhizobium sp. RAF56 TaxID=3233062 RepID=UPI003F95FC77